MKRLKELIPDMNSKDWDLLAKYRDDPKWSKNLRSHTMT
jgi:hypothetical protein